MKPVYKQPDRICDRCTDDLLFTVTALQTHRRKHTNEDARRQRELAAIVDRYKEAADRVRSGESTFRDEVRNIIDGRR